jgi:hypothetical protein
VIIAQFAKLVQQQKHQRHVLHANVVRSQVDHVVVVKIIVQFVRPVQPLKHQLLVHHVHVELNIQDHVAMESTVQFARFVQQQKHQQPNRHVQLAHAALNTVDHAEVENMNAQFVKSAQQLQNQL